MTKDFTIENLENSFQALTKNNIPGFTVWHVFASDDEKRCDYCVVMSKNVNEENPGAIYGKVAYIPYNSYMHDYDIDFSMPYDEKTGEVDDTEIEINNTLDLKWLYIQAQRIEKENVIN